MQAVYGYAWVLVIISVYRQGHWLTCYAEPDTSAQLQLIWSTNYILHLTPSFRVQET